MKTAQLYDEAVKQGTGSLLGLFIDQDQAESMQRNYSLSLNENKKNGWDFVKLFKENNDKHRYFPDNEQTYERYKQIYLALKIFSLLKDNIYFFDRKDGDFFAYQVMVYFGGEGDTQKTLEAFDAYCKKDNRNDAQLSQLFPTQLRELTQSISLTHWQTIIRQHASRNLWSLFDVAPEIEQFLGQAPAGLEEVNATILRLVKEKPCSHEELVRMVLASDSVSRWITELNDHNLGELINGKNAFCKVMPCINDAKSQKAVLIRLGFQKTSLTAERGVNLKQMMAAVQLDNMGEVLQLVHFNQQIAQCASRASLIGLIEDHLYHEYQSTYLMNQLDKKDLKRCTHNAYDVLCFLQKVAAEDQFKFLTTKIGKENFLALKPRRGDFFAVLSNLPIENRLQFVEEILPDEELTSIHKSNSDWRKLKADLQTEEAKSALNKRVYSDEALRAKAILKNIKNTIKSTPWVDEFLAPLEMTEWKGNIRAPASVHEQIDVYKALSAGCRTHEEALAEVKKRGREVAIQYKSVFSSMSGLLFGKSQTQAYFEHFETEERFDAKFGFKPSPK